MVARLRIPGTRRGQKRARKAFVALLRRLRKAAGTVQTVDNTRRLFDEVRSLLAQNKGNIPADSYARLTQATQMGQSTGTGVSTAIDALQFELGHLVGILPAGGAAAAAVIVGAVAVAAAVGGAVTYANVNAAEIAVRNDGCKPIILSGGAIPGLTSVANLVGFNFPTLPIADGAEGKLSLPPLPLKLNTTVPGSYSVGIAGVSLPLPIGEDVVDLQVDGEHILGREATIDLRAKGQHQLIITCRARR